MVTNAETKLPRIESQAALLGLLSSFNSRCFRGYAVASIILNKAFKLILLNSSFASDFINFNFKNKNNFEQENYINLRPTDLPYEIRNKVRKLYAAFPGINTSQIKEKLNLPGDAGILPIEYKWFFNYYSKYGGRFNKYNIISDEELLTPLTDSEKNELQHLIV